MKKPKKRRGRPVLPTCYRHPGRKCPGECQYIARAKECVHDLVAAGKWVRVNPRQSNLFAPDVDEARYHAARRRL